MSLRRAYHSLLETRPFFNDHALSETGRWGTIIHFPKPIVREVSSLRGPKTFAQENLET